MSHDHESQADEIATGATALAPAEPVPDFLVRAGRILNGDIRPEDYLVVPAEVQEEIDREYAGAEQYTVHRQHTLNNWVLSYLYCETGPVICRETEQGVIVFAVGTEQIREFLEYFPRADQRPNVIGVTPFPWQPRPPKN